MNYIHQLTSAIEQISKETDFNPSHVSLYLALFHHWNMNRFVNPISVCRSEMMNVSKIGSKSTYHKCLKDLHKNGFIVYHPSYNPLKGSLIDMTIFQSGSRTATVHVVDKNRTGTVQALVPSINSINNLNNKKNSSFYLEENEEKPKSKGLETERSKGSGNGFNTPNMEEILSYFLELKSSVSEAEKFFNYYSSKGWVVGNKSPMKDWKAAARNWKMNSDKFQTSSKLTENSIPMVGNLHVNQDKSYDIPL